MSPEPTRRRWKTWTPTVLALLLGLGWAGREVAFALEKAEQVASRTIALEDVRMHEVKVDGKLVGQNGVYTQGETPASSEFVTGRFVLEPGQTPHPPHTHVAEEVMIVESGHGEIYCDGKTTRVGPGSVMFTGPNVSHGINNTGVTPIVFYYVKWAAKEKP